MLQAAGGEGGGGVEGEDGEPPSPSMARRAHRHGSSGNRMLDQLLADISNKFVTYVDEVRERADIQCSPRNSKLEIPGKDLN